MNEHASPEAAGATAAKCRSVPGLRTVVESRGLTLIHEKCGALVCIPYPYAALWDLLQRGSRMDGAVRMMTFVARVPADAAETLILAALRDWQALGVLTSEDRRDESVPDLGL